jgi:hypothetical protein
MAKKEFLVDLTVDGKIGIGTDDPTQKLDIRDGELVFTSSVTNQNPSGRIRFNEHDDSQVAGAYIDYDGATNAFSMFTNDTSNDYEFLRANRNGDLLLQPSGNNVGIGTDSTGAKLDIKTNNASQIPIRITHNAFNDWIIQKRRSDNSQLMGLKELNSNGSLGLVTNNSVRMTVNNLGDVGIGDDTPSYKLDVTGSIRATGSITENSDESLKENIQTIDNACDKVSKLRGVSYNKIGEEDKKIGVIAQEIETVVPEVVTEDVDGIKSVSYTNLVGLLIQSNKELIERVSELENIINNKD